MVVATELEQIMTERLTGRGEVVLLGQAGNDFAARPQTTVLEQKDQLDQVVICRKRFPTIDRPEPRNNRFHKRLGGTLLNGVLETAGSVSMEILENGKCQFRHLFRWLLHPSWTVVVLRSSKTRQYNVVLNVARFQELVKRNGGFVVEIATGLVGAEFGQ